MDRRPPLPRRRHPGPLPRHPRPRHHPGGAPHQRPSGAQRLTRPEDHASTANTTSRDLTMAGRQSRDGGLSMPREASPERERQREHIKDSAEPRSSSVTGSVHTSCAACCPASSWIMSHESRANMSIALCCSPGPASWLAWRSRRYCSHALRSADPARRDLQRCANFALWSKPPSRACSAAAGRAESGNRDRVPRTEPPARSRSGRRCRAAGCPAAHSAR